MEVNGYKYKGLPLIPSICRELIIELYQGKTVERKVIIEEVKAVHKLRGGTPGRADNVGTVKKALKTLLDEGNAENPSVGFWRIKLHDEENTIIEKENNDYDEGTVEEIDSTEFDSIDEFSEIEENTGVVYLYYFPSYKELALLKNSSTWRCKIGMTEGDPLVRITSQGVTILPEKPIIETFTTKHPRMLETVIHKILTINGSKSVDSPGSEWFETSPQEFFNIISFIENKNYRIEETE